MLAYRDDPESELIGCARILNGPVIGRIVVAEAARGEGVGHLLMKRAIAECEEHSPGQPIRMSVQSHLKEFYRSHGFEVTGEPYSEDGIDHTDMVRR